MSPEQCPYCGQFMSLVDYGSEGVREGVVLKVAPETILAEALATATSVPIIEPRSRPAVREQEEGQGA